MDYKTIIVSVLSGVSASLVTIFFQIGHKIWNWFKNRHKRKILNKLKKLFNEGYWAVPIEYLFDIYNDDIRFLLNELQNEDKEIIVTESDHLTKFKKSFCNDDSIYFKENKKLASKIKTTDINSNEYNQIEKFVLLKMDECFELITDCEKKSMMSPYIPTNETDKTVENRDRSRRGSLNFPCR